MHAEHLTEPPPNDEHDEPSSYDRGDDLHRRTGVGMPTNRTADGTREGSHSTQNLRFGINQIISFAQPFHSWINLRFGTVAQLFRNGISLLDAVHRVGQRGRYRQDHHARLLVIGLSVQRSPENLEKT